MANQKIWSMQRRNYIKSLIPNKKIQFATVNGNSKARLKDTNDNYDIVIALHNDTSTYYAFDASLHKNRKTASLDCFTQNDKRKRTITVGYRRTVDNRLLYERIIRIPNCKIEEFGKSVDYYMKTFEMDKCTKPLGQYDNKTQSIIELKYKTKE